MSYGNLNCSANNCGHNNGGSCFAGSINVSGRSATTTSSTSCSSFVDQASNAFTNCANCTCTKPDSIKCEAVNCSYNEGKSCKAGAVQINAQNASCETFVTK